MPSSAFSSCLLAPWFLLWACIRSWFGLAGPVKTARSELQVISGSDNEPHRSTVRDDRGIAALQSSVTPGSSDGHPTQSSPRPSHAPRPPSSPATPTPNYTHSSQESPCPATLSLCDSTPTARPLSKLCSPPSLSASSPVMLLRSGAQDSTELGALAQRRGFKGSPIVVEPTERLERWKATKPSTNSNDSFTEPNTPGTSRSLKVKFGNLLRSVPSPMPPTPLSPLSSPLPDDTQKGLWYSDPFSVDGDSYFTPDVSRESSNGSCDRSAMYNLGFYTQLSAGQGRRGKKKTKLPASRKQDRHIRVMIYDSSIYDFGIGSPRHSTPIQDKRVQQALKRKHHEKAYSTNTLPNKQRGHDLPPNLNQSSRPLQRSTTTRRYCIVMSESETRRMEVESLV